MACQNCPKPSCMWIGGQDGGRIELCLDCYERFMRIQEQRLDSLARMMNFSLAEIDAVTGFGRSPRIELRPPPVISGAVFNNIDVSHSVVGTVNTGTVGSIDQSITVLNESGSGEAAAALAALTQALIESQELPAQAKRDAVDALEAVATEARKPADQRKKGLALATLDFAHKSIGAVKNLSDLFDKYVPVIAGLFG